MALDQSQIDVFNRALQNQVANINSASDGSDAMVTTSNAPSGAVLYAMEVANMSPSDYAQMSGVSASTAQQMYDQGLSTGPYSTQTIPGTQTTWASINQVPGMYDYVMQQSSVDDGNGDGDTVFDPSKAAQAVNSGMQNPIGIAKDYLTTQAQMVTMGSGVNSPTYLKDAIGYLANNGVSPNDIQALAQSGVNNGINTVNYMNANSGGFGGFLGQTLDAVAGQIATPTGIASIIANTLLPGSGALVKTIADAAGGQQNLTSDLVGMAMAQYGTSVPGTSNITGALSNYVPSSVAQDMTAGALVTAANLSQGKNLEDSLASGIATGVSTGLNNSASANSPYATPNTPAPVVDLSTAPPSGLPPEGGLTQINSGNGLGNTLPMSPSSGTSFDPTAPQDINSISQSVTSGSTDPTAQATTGLPPIDTTQPSLNDITQGVAPTVASGNSALTSQILPSATDIVSRVDNFDGTSTVTYKDGTTAIVDTPNSAPNYNPTTGTTNSGNATNNPTSSTTTSPLGSVGSSGSNSSSGSSSQSPPLGSSAYNPLAATVLSTGTVLNRSPLEQALGVSEATLEPSQLDQLNSQNTNPYMPQNISEGSPDIKFAKDGGSMGGLGRYEHKPEFVTGHTGYYAQGGGTGQSDDIPALLKDGDYVMDADIVAALGDGSNKAGAEALHHFMEQFPHKHYENHSTGGHINAMIADGEFVFPSSLVTALGGGSNKEGAKKLDDMREKIREHKRSASTNKIPPKAKSPLSYMEKK
jgi:hypothetical protein